MTDLTLVDRLAAHRTVGRAPRPQLEWLAHHGELRSLAPGDLVADDNAPITSLWVVLSGLVAIRIERPGGPRTVMQWSDGDVSGLIPFSRLSRPPGTARVEQPSEVLIVPGSSFREMVRECYELTEILVHVMVDRARVFNTSDLQVEKILSLGRLAAGLAHELNNPASAVARGAETLRQLLTDAERAAERLAAAGLAPGELDAIGAIRSNCADRPRDSSPVSRSDREAELAERLAARGLDPMLAPVLADANVAPLDLDDLAVALGPAKIAAALHWMAATCAARGIAGEVAAAATRIHHLVDAVRGFTYLDQARTPKAVDIEKGLRDTLAVLGHKGRSRSIATTLSVEAGLPPVSGFGGELNQVWANLIDNALDAVEASGRVDIAATREGRFVVVRVTDNGPGIPDAVRPRVFEPFFTTKPVGVGTGLGLDIARRIVSSHEGSIEFDTRPGRTEFRVFLPAASADRSERS